MRVLFSCMAFSGHFHPLAPVATAARDAGHAVAFVAAEPLRSQVERLGLAFFPTERVDALAEFRRRWPNVQAMEPTARQGFVRRHFHADLLVESQLPGVRAAIESWQPDVIVRDPLSFAGCLIGEQVGIPHAVIDVWAVGGRMYRRDTIDEPLNAWRSRLDLTGDPELSMLERYLTLVPFPPSFRSADPCLAATAHYLRPSAFSASGPEGLPSWMETLQDRPTVHMTLGTFFNARTSALRATIDALADRPVNLILTTGRDQDPDALGPLPTNVRAERYIPYSKLLPYCDLVMSHVGAGTITAAGWYGLPQIAMPLADDQFANADLVVRLGVGEQLTETERTPHRIAEVVEHVLGDDHYRTAATRLQREMQTLPPIEVAVTLLEHLGRERRPILRS